MTLNAINSWSRRLDAIEARLTAIEAKQDKELKLLNQILTQVQPPPVARLVLTLGQPQQQ